MYMSSMSRGFAWVQFFRVNLLLAVVGKLVGQLLSWLLDYIVKYNETDYMRQECICRYKACLWGYMGYIDCEHMAYSIMVKY
jgi:hypothetical protein